MFDSERLSALVSGVIPYLGDFEMLSQCLESVKVQTWPDIEVILVDNGTGDGQLDLTGHRVIRNARNEGFARAANQACQLARGEFVLVLNPDVKLDPNYVERCVTTLEGNETTAGVSGKLVKLADSSVIDSTGHVLFGDRRVKDRGEWEVDRGQYESEQEVFSFPATAALFRRSALEDVQAVCGEVFDEDFFAYGEDVDLAWRLRLRGWSLRYEPKAVAFHRRAVSGRRIPTPLLVWDWRNRHLRTVKNDTGAGLIRHWWEIALTELRLFLYFLIRRPQVPFMAWAGFFRLLPSALRKRGLIQRSRKVPWRELESWFVRYDYRGFVRRLRRTRGG